MKVTFLTKEYSEFVESCYQSHRDAPKPIIAALGVAEEYLEYSQNKDETELGDIIYWLTILANRYGVSEPNVSTGHYSLETSVLNLVRIIKRRYRKEDVGITTIQHAIHDVFASIAIETCECTNYSAGLYLRKLVANNVEKLTSRKQRGVLLGTGDYR